MATTLVIHDLAIFLTDNPLGRHPEVEDVHSDSPAVTVLSKVQRHDAANLIGGLPDPAWDILFIGSITEFHQSFAMGMSQAFDHGKARSPHGKRSGTDFVRLVNEKAAQAKPLTARSLRFLGIDAVTWSRDEAVALGIDQHPNIAKAAFFENVRYGFEISDTEDARRMVLYALTLKRFAHTMRTKTDRHTGCPDKTPAIRLKSSLAY